MSDQDGAQSSTKLRRSRKTNTANQQNDKQARPMQHPANEDKEAWKAYWKAQGQPWRTEPEIDLERQKYLTECRTTTPDIHQDIYPFKGIHLTRADIEWLLATHENGRGPVYWNDDNQREREGLDLRGADLRQENLSNLPLARLRCALNIEEVALLLDPSDALEESVWEIHLEDANLSNAHLEGANLIQAHLENAQAYGAFLDEALLSGAHLERTFLNSASLKGTILADADLGGTILKDAHLENANLIGAYLGKTYLYRAFLEGIDLKNATLRDVNGVGPYLVDIHWGDANLAVVKWSQIKMLGNEHEAREKLYQGEEKYHGMRLAQYEEAVRANRQLSIALQAQGLNEYAARFAFRAQALQKEVWRFQMTQNYIKMSQRVQPLGAWLFSWFLFLLAGYGYKPWRSFAAYLITILGFAITYFLIGQTAGPSLSPLGSFVFSMTSFHLSKVRYKKELKVRC